MFSLLSKNPMVIKHTGLQTRVTLSRTYFDKCLWPLTNIIWKKNQIRRNSPGSSSRIIVGLSGCGGCGKTFLAAMLQQALSLMFQQAHEKATCIVLGMDGECCWYAVATSLTYVFHQGYHFPNAYLREHNLVHIKGRPPSLDVRAFLHDLKMLQKKVSRLHISAAFGAKYVRVHSCPHIPRLRDWFRFPFTTGNCTNL